MQHVMVFLSFVNFDVSSCLPRVGKPQFMAPPTSHTGKCRAPGCEPLLFKVERTMPLAVWICMWFSVCRVVCLRSKKTFPCSYAEHHHCRQNKSFDFMVGWAEKHRTDIRNPLYIIKKGQSRERLGPAQWQYDHRKAKDSTANVHKRGHNSIVHRWITDPYYQAVSMPTWTLEYCKFLDNLKTVNVDYVACWHGRDRYQNMFVLRYKDGKNPGKMSKRDDF